MFAGGIGVPIVRKTDDVLILHHTDTAIMTGPARVFRRLYLSRDAPRFSSLNLQNLRMNAKRPTPILQYEQSPEFIAEVMASGFMLLQKTPQARLIEIAAGRAA
jgi:hypothetical protein